MNRICTKADELRQQRVEAADMWPECRAGFAGIKPIRENFYGLCFADEKKRSRWLDEMRDYGRRAR
ncbi:hypothetical protein [Sinorhizobium meliloti]|jgi:hypothetical protein|uniref:hypothetical protein n=1 Tax=Rhizobium meliloti TaxID=382 RepID=UPI001F22B697|nr:hypothetical protein [Sinorhizobium meliloti]